MTVQFQKRGDPEPRQPSAAMSGLCRDLAMQRPAAVLAGTTDPNYQELLSLCAAGTARLRPIVQSEMRNSGPPKEWPREMKRYGLLPADITLEQLINVCTIEQDDWRSLWHKPSP